MKKIIFGLLIAILFASCADKNAYTIIGKIKGIEDGTKITLYMDKYFMDTLSTTVTKKGEFRFTGIQEEPEVRFLSIEGKTIEVAEPVGTILAGIPIVIEPGTIRFVNDGGYGTDITGSPLNEKNVAFWSSLGQSDKADEELLFDFIKENTNNTLGIYALMSDFYSYTPDQLKEVLALMPDKYKQRDDVKRMQESIVQAEATAIGTKYKDLKGLTPEGKEISLSDYVGKDKVVLVDFWASWSYSSGADIPDKAKLYTKYKDKGFEIIGVSLDRDNNDWVEGVKKFGLTWPQMSDLKYKDSELAKVYGVYSIPYNILIDEDGNIIDRYIRPWHLEKKIEDLFE